MKILCVCGLGMGSSLILKMSVDSAMRQLGVLCDIEHCAAGTMLGMSYDLMVASDDFKDEMEGKENVVFVKNVIKVDEIREVLKEYLEAKGLLG
jgi:PTS system ascorbate-specific IIB component